MLRQATAFALSAAMVFTLPMSIYADGTVRYADGTFEGSGTGYRSKIILNVTITDGSISAIETVSQDETPQYWKEALQMFDRIKEKGSTDVDTVSGATYSSEGIIDAVDEALKISAQAWADKDDDAVFSSGAGTERNPYIIRTATQLANFAKAVDEGENYEGEFIALGADIDISSVENWNPIGVEGASKDNTSKLFSGTFDGQGYTVSGMKISGEFDTEANVGLFSTLNNIAVVKNVTVKNATVSITGKDQTRAGLIAGDTVSVQTGGTEPGTLIDGCSVQGTIDVSTDQDKLVWGGGIAGRLFNMAKAVNCVSDVDITTSSTGGSKSAYAGGIAGTTGTNTLIANCAAFGDMSAASPKSTNFGGMAGGIVGMHGGKLYNCYATGNVTIGNGGSVHKWVGALAGEITMAGMDKTSDGSYVYPETGAFRDKCYYASDAELKIDKYADAATVSSSEKVEPVTAAGSTESTTPYDKIFETLAKAKTKAEMAEASFAEELNANIYDITKLLSAYNINDVSLKIWKLDGGKVILSSDNWVNGEIDASIFESGTGTKADPYVIHNETQLRAFAGSMNEKIDYTGKYIVLDADISVSSAEWTPIGGSDYAFNGSFDGQEHTVSGMNIGTISSPHVMSADDVYIGFFGVLNKDAAVSNLKLTGVSIYTNFPEASGIVGSIAGATEGYAGEDRRGTVIDNCSVSGLISHTSSNGNNFVGGIVGMQNHGAVINCKSEVQTSCVVTKGDNIAEAGGIVGILNRGLVANCISLESVYGSASRSDGDEGMAAVSNLAAVNAGSVVGCYASGAVTTEEYSVYAGMVSGWITGIGKAYNCWYDLETGMTVDGKVVNPPEAVGTKVTAGVNEDGDLYTGGLVDKLNGFKFADLQKVVESLNDNFSAYPIDISLYGLDSTALRKWYAGENDIYANLGSERATVTYKQPDCEIVPEKEVKLLDGTWYGRDTDKTCVVKITVKDNAVTETSVISGTAAEGDAAYDAALENAKYKATYGDTTDFAAADTKKFAGGSGTAEDPYLISNEAQLRYLASSINKDVDWSGKYFKQTASINITGGSWLPIGWALSAEVNGKATQICAYPFRGNYDGGNYSITGLKINSDSSVSDLMTVGLFGLTDGQYTNNDKPTGDEQTVTLKNIKLKDISFDIKAKYQTYTGGLVGNAQYGIYIDNCQVSGSIKTETSDSFNRAAGLAGNALRGSVTNCGTDVDINAVTDAGQIYAGGMFAMPNRVTTVNCYALGDVTVKAASNNKTHAGGFSGQAGGIQINCYAAGNVVSVNPTSDIGGVNGRSGGIAADYNTYFNSEAKQQNGNTVNTENVGIGVNANDAALAVNVTGKTAAELASADFAAELNKNASEEGLNAALDKVNEFLNGGLTNGLIHLNYYNGTPLLSWVVKDGIVVLNSPEASGGSGGSGSGGSSGGSGGGNNSGTNNSGQPTTPPSGQSGFSDVQAGAYYKPAVDWAVEKNITSGKTASLFAPDEACTRAQAVTFLWRAAGSPEPTSSENKFTDVKADAYYYKAVLWAVEKGITSGTSATTFSPDKTVSRAEMATFLWRYAETPAITGTGSFTDVSTSAYYHNAVLWAAEKGITSGTSATTFSPDNNCTRAQIVTFLYRHMN